GGGGAGAGGGGGRGGRFREGGGAGRKRGGRKKRRGGGAPPPPAANAMTSAVTIRGDAIAASARNSGKSVAVSRPIDRTPPASIGGMALTGMNRALAGPRRRRTGHSNRSAKNRPRLVRGSERPPPLRSRQPSAVDPPAAPP